MPIYPKRAYMTPKKPFHKKTGEIKMSSNSSGSRLGFVGLLTILFIALKLTEVIEWSWVWILAPIWISTIIAFVLIIALAMMDQ